MAVSNLLFYSQWIDWARVTGLELARRVRVDDNGEGLSTFHLFLKQLVGVFSETLRLWETIPLRKPLTLVVWAVRNRDPLADTRLRMRKMMIAWTHVTPGGANVER